MKTGGAPTASAAMVEIFQSSQRREAKASEPETRLAPDPTPLTPHWSGWRRQIARGCALGLCLALVCEAGRVLLGRNLHTVIPGRVYRSAQMSGGDLERFMRGHGIRTVVNLRGCCDPLAWYLEESRATHQLAVAQEDICLSAGRLPAVPEMRRLAEVLERTEYPILLHCYRGADRTGLASAVALLLQTDQKWADVRGQLGLRYGHVPLGRPAYLDEFFDLYLDWLRQESLTHSRATFRRWLLHDYCPAECRCDLQLLSKAEGGTRKEEKESGFDSSSILHPSSCLSVRRGQPVAVRVRAHHTGTRPWRLRPGTNAGIHLGFFLWDADGHVLAHDRAGLYAAEVEPGQAIDLTLALPAIHQPGRYRLMIDMMDEQHCWFYQTGSEPLERELEVRE